MVQAKPMAAFPPPPHAPHVLMPKGGIDAHVHLIGAPSEYAPSEHRAEDLPEETLARWLNRYRAHLQALGASKGVLVHSVLYGTDNSVTLDALRALGDGFVGVGLAGEDVSDAELDHLRAAGIKALRLNLVHGGVLSWAGAKALAPRLAARDMHLEILLHSHLHLAEIADDIRQLPVKLVIDHIGWPVPEDGVDVPGFLLLRQLLADAAIYVKLSAVYRMTSAPYQAMDQHISALATANPERCVWGSDWPHLMRGGAAMPVAAELWDALVRAVPLTETQQKIAVNNPVELYGL